MSKKLIAFADGENLVFAYQTLKAAGRVDRAGVHHEQDCFVWADDITTRLREEIVRVHYYTSVVGDDPRVASVTAKISNTQYRWAHGFYANDYGYGQAQLIPRVHKKPKQSTKTKVVDIDVTMDVMRAALTMPIDGIVLLSGDRDYLPLIQEVVRATSKQVYLAAFSDGLAADLKTSVEHFIDLDEIFFVP